MRLSLAVAALVSFGVAFSAPPDGPISGAAPSQHTRGAGQAIHPPVITPRMQPRIPMPGRDHFHHRGGDVFFYPYPPYPMTWPYPPYPWSNYYYPYPPYGYSDTIYDDDNDHPMPSTRGLVVPGELPVGITATWYYCDTPDGYYPYVKTCLHPWSQIPVAPPPPGAATPVSYSDWLWCEESKSFFPYVSSCKAGFVSMHVTVPGKDQAGTPQTASWFFCNDPKGYAPYVVQCKGDWRPVPAVPPPSVKITVQDGSDTRGK